MLGYRYNSCFSIWTPESAWLLGYIWADGCITRNRLQFKCSTGDEILLKQARCILASENRIRRYPKQFRGGYWIKPISCLTLCSMSLVNELVLKGISYRKSFTDPRLPAIPDAYFRYFALGVHDGDGYCYESKGGYWGIGFCGTPRFISEFQRKLCRLSGASFTTISREKAACHSFRWSSLEDLLKLTSFLRPPGFDYGLARKWDPFLHNLADRLTTPHGQKYQSLVDNLNLLLPGAH